MSDIDEIQNEIQREFEEIDKEQEICPCTKLDFESKILAPFGAKLI